MTQTAQQDSIHEFYTLRKDVGVAIVLFVALALGWLLRTQTENRITVFQDAATRFRIAYPATWGTVESLTDALLKVENPRSDSAFRTTLTVEARGLDPSSPPTLQQLVDRRVAQHASLTGYHFLSSEPATVGGARALRQDYAYVVQPLDEPRRASPPVVVHAVEYVAVTQDNVLYITLAAPESDMTDAAARLPEIMQTVQMQ